MAPTAASRPKWATSEIPDEVDPAPRILRMVAAMLHDGTPGRPNPDTPSGRGVKMAEILEGAVADRDVRQQAWAALATSERRVPKRRPIKPSKLVPVTVRTAQEERWRQQLIDAGQLPPDAEEEPRSASRRLIEGR